MASPLRFVASRTSFASRRKRRVLNELLRGKDAAGVAQELGLATVTVHNHTRAIYAAFSVTSRVDLMALFVVRP